MVHVDFWQGRGMGTENLYTFNLAKTEVCITMSTLWWLSIHVTIVIHFSPVSVLRLGGYWLYLPAVIIYACQKETDKRNIGPINL